MRDLLILKLASLRFYYFTMSIITGTFLSDCVYVRVCVVRKFEQNINKGRKEMQWDFLIMPISIFLFLLFL